MRFLGYFLDLDDADIAIRQGILANDEESYGGEGEGEQEFDKKVEKVVQKVLSMPLEVPVEKKMISKSVSTVSRVDPKIQDLLKDCIVEVSSDKVAPNLTGDDHFSAIAYKDSLNYIALQVFKGYSVFKEGKIFETYDTNGKPYSLLHPL